MSRTDVGSQGVCTAEYVCGVPGTLESGEEDAVQLSMKDVSMVRQPGLNISEVDTTDSCESGVYTSKTFC